MRATRTTSSADAPTFAVKFAFARVTVATCFGNTVIVSGVEGNATPIGGRWLAGALGSLLYGIWAWPRSTSVYVPGVTLAFTITGAGNVSLPGLRVTGWLLLITKFAGSVLENGGWLTVITVSGC